MRQVSIADKLMAQQADRLSEIIQGRGGWGCERGRLTKSQKQTAQQKRAQQYKQQSSGSAYQYLQPASFVKNSFIIIQKHGPFWGKRVGVESKR
jgi:hypothetical protein